MAIAFEKEFRKGSASYEADLARWWITRSQDEVHRAAHRNVVRFMQRFLRGQGIERPRTIVDYACGNGSLIGLLAKQFPASRILALDGSKRMLTHARDNLQASGLISRMITPGLSRNGDRIELMHTPLPNFDLPATKADALVFLFPNMTISKKERRALRKQVATPPLVRDSARGLARLAQWDTGDPPHETMEDLLDARAIALNIRGLLKRGGYWFEIDYANAPRKQWDPLDQSRTLFEESADFIAGGRRLPRLFRLLQSSYYPSSVVLDVYEQSGDANDRKGGYAISVLQAV